MPLFLRCHPEKCMHIALPLMTLSCLQEKRCMNGNPFIDTNIWVYAHLQKTGSNKCNIALALLETLH
jgi:hypothetical protein